MSVAKALAARAITFLLDGLQGPTNRESREILEQALADSELRREREVREATEHRTARRERCLIARAVAANIDVRVAEDQGGGFLVAAHRAGEDEDVERNVPAAEVPATLARLLDEVEAARKGGAK